MSIKDYIKLFLGIFITITGFIVLVENLCRKKGNKDDLGRTFTQASMWFIGGLIIIFS